MSTAIQRYFTDARHPPIWHLVLGWVMLLPLLFFSTNGNLIPVSADPKVRIVAGGSEALSHRLPTALVIIICVTLILSRYQLVLSMCRQAKVLLALPVLALLSCLWSEDRQQSVISAVILFVFTLFALYIAGSLSPQRQLELVVFVGAIILPLSIAVSIFLPNIGDTPTGWCGVLGDKNNLGMVATLLLVTLLHWQPHGIFQKVSRIAYVIMAAVLIVMSKSRGGWGLACLALFLLGGLWLLQKMALLDSIAVALAAIPVLSGIGYAIYHFGPLLLQTVGKDPTLNQRTIIWAAVWTAVTKRLLFGYGYCAFWTGLDGPSNNIVLIAGWALRQAQDGFLDLWLQLGVFGVALVVAAFAVALRDIVRCFRGSRHRNYVRWSVIVLVCTFVYNIGESSLGLDRISWLLFLVACAGLRQIARAGQYHAPSSFSSQSEAIRMASMA